MRTLVVALVPGRPAQLFDILDEKLAPAKAALEAEGIAVETQMLNVTSEAEWARAVAWVVDTCKGLDILVQAAGITGKTGIKTHEVRLPCHHLRTRCCHCACDACACRSTRPTSTLS